jgi:outer membrane protein OmpA-like peptidoglycan-associated protein
MIRLAGNVLVLSALALALLAGPAQAEITTTSDATALTDAALRDPSLRTGASWDVPAAAEASAVATDPLVGFPTHGSDYLILSSGNTSQIPGSDQNILNSSPTGGGNRGGANDVAALRIDLDVPVGRNCLTLAFRYLSEEWPGYVGLGYNDGFLAELDPASPWTMTDHQITAPANFAFMPGGAFVSINTAAMSWEAAQGTVLNGGTELLSATTPITPGTHSLVLSVWDDGDIGYDSAAFVDDISVFTTVADGCVAGAVEADTTPPDTTIDSGPSALSSSAAASFEFSADEAGTTFECRLDAGAWEPCSSPRDYPGLADGPHSLEVRAVDGSANADPTPASRAWTVDTSAPAAPEILSGPSGTTTEWLAGFAFAGEADATLECRVDGGAWTPCADSVDLAGLGLGEHVLELRQTDAAGNVSAVTGRTWTIVAETPAAETPTAETPAAETPVSAVAPKLLRASVGSRARRGARRVAVADGGRVLAGCAVDRGAIRRCTVTAWAGGKLVGRGAARYRAQGVRSGRVAVRLTRAMRARVGRTRKLPRLTFRFSAEAVGRSKPLKARLAAFVAPRTQWILPTDGLFESGSARLLPHVRAYLHAIARDLGAVRAVECVGHTDSIGTYSANERLGLRRAQAVCAYLRRAGLRGLLAPSSRGETRPRAGNDTWTGRWRNRRVELRVVR